MRRKCFISYYSGDQTEVDGFIWRWAALGRVFIPKVIGCYDQDLIESDDSSYIMAQVRARYLEDSTVTLVMLGRCTHSRRYIGWEIKSSLRQGALYTPNGLAGIILPSSGTAAFTPPRFAQNWHPQHLDCYARLWVAPTTAEELRLIIEDAYIARTERNHLIQNPAEMMRYNAQCRTCGFTHPA